MFIYINYHKNKKLNDISISIYGEHIEIFDKLLTDLAYLSEVISRVDRCNILIWK